MPVVVISYRRDESASEAGRLYALLQSGYKEGELYMDTTSNSWASSWPDELEAALHTAKAVIAVVGPNWLRANDEWGQRRIDQNEDWVRREFEVALSSGKAVVPLLLEGGKMTPTNYAYTGGASRQVCTAGTARILAA